MLITTRASAHVVQLDAVHGDGVIADLVFSHVIPPARRSGGRYLARPTLQDADCRYGEELGCGSPLDLPLFAVPVIPGVRAAVGPGVSPGNLGRKIVGM
jgi:hypothetical protein